MKLKGRLKLIADKVPRCRTVCDIGTDHAYVPIYLVKNKICEKAIAIDIKEGPANAAVENVRRYNLQECIEIRVGNGLDPVKEGECDAVIIAGMGGTLIREILLKGFYKVQKAGCLILQPMNALEEVREWLYRNGFDIYDEELAAEGQKIYNVIAAKWTGKNSWVEEIYHHIGKKLIEKNDPLLGKYIQRKLKQIEKATTQMRMGKGHCGGMEDLFERMREDLLRILTGIEGMYYERKVF